MKILKNTSIFIVILVISVLIVSPFITKKLIDENLRKEAEAVIDDDFNGIDEIVKPDALNTEAENLDVIKIEKGKVNEIKNSDAKNEVKDDKKNNNTSSSSNKPATSSTSTKNSKDYFTDALFIGDSRTVGIAEYGTIKNATYFANTGMSVYNIWSQKIDISSIGKVSLGELLDKKNFGKVYIMLGINEIGYNMSQTAKKYQELLKYVNTKQPKAIIYLQANLHVTKEKSDSDKTINNTRINKLNSVISKMANNKNIFYLDVNSIFDDSSGNLRADYTSDKVHIYGKYYKQWTEWIRKNTKK